MVFWGNYEKSTCLFCQRRISKTNCPRHGAVCWPKHIVVMLAVYGYGWLPEWERKEVESGRWRDQENR